MALRRASRRLLGDPDLLRLADDGPASQDGSGDGGDEIFAAYTRYRVATRTPAWSWIPEGIRRHTLGPLAGGLPIDWPGRNRFHEITHYSGLVPGYGFGLYQYIKERLYSPAMRATLAGNPPLQSTLATLLAGSSLDWLSRLQYLDTVHYLPDDILTKVHRASMAHSLEVRAPLLDYTLVEFLATVPARYKVRDGVPKYLLRWLVRKYLPESVLSKCKQGFGVPKGAWFRTELREHVWCLPVLEEWHRTFVDSDTRRI